MHSVILIEKYFSSSFFWPHLLKDKRIPNLSVEEILNMYQGFEGEMVCYFEISKIEDNYNKKISELSELKQLGHCALLHTLSRQSEMPHFFQNDAVRIGYDIGACEEEGSIYSSIFHEILFGHVDELVSYKDVLNENFLFPNRSLAEKYVEVHNKMSAQGKDVEDYMEMVIYEIWKYTGTEQKR